MSDRLTTFVQRIGTHLPRKIELAIEGLKVLQSLASYKLLVEPDLVVCRSPREEALADVLRKLVHLSVQPAVGRYARHKDVTIGDKKKTASVN